MKIYKAEPVSLLRISIMRTGDQPERFSIVEATVQEFIEACKAALEKNEAKAPVNFDMVKTSINVREAIGGINGKSKSISFFGLSPLETKDLILDYIEKQNKKVKQRFSNVITEDQGA